MRPICVRGLNLMGPGCRHRSRPISVCFPAPSPYACLVRAFLPRGEARAVHVKLGARASVHARRPFGMCACRLAAYCHCLVTSFHPARGHAGIAFALGWLIFDPIVIIFRSNVSFTKRILKTRRYQVVEKFVVVPAAGLAKAIGSAGLRLLGLNS